MIRLWILRSLPAVMPLVLMACSTLTPGEPRTAREQFAAVRAAAVELAEESRISIARDNARVSVCYRTHPDLRGDAAREACPPALSPEARHRIREINLALRSEIDAAEALLLIEDVEGVRTLTRLLETQAILLAELLGGAR